MATDAQMKSEIARLTASINQHKSSISKPPYRANSYVNPNYRPAPNKYIRPPTFPPVVPAPIRFQPGTQVKKEVVLNGVAFESSKRSLVRKDCKFSFAVHPNFDLAIVPMPPSTSIKPPSSAPPPTRRPNFLTKPGARVYKPKSSRGRPRGGPVNMTLNNSRRPYQSGRRTNKRLNKPCPQFTTTGSCSRGLTCPYLHDPAKIAICWKFLQGNCANTAETCNLSHDPTPQRTPLCLHFLNNGRCTREACLFPHVNVGARQGVCRDFAVLGYCERGLDCDKQHVRECPDFAERGECATPRCKLPHVIRANRNRQATTSVAKVATTTPAPLSLPAATDSAVSAKDAQLGDEYISLTFHESESDEESDEEESESEGSEEQDDGSNGDSP
ncbi:hypothetical protein MIND_00372900 [Mycena indigotica]|uniref:C3H1-type domain-containing protein n=1 Tax=Mycena indigotica TaxID=2126181 RepID=A0A8H6T4C2_9AGAR|nr:uncharacterized protein MIND_00372900 [Mycena indigotica]KAF7310001.1 hypothetical protein MIND_00372900 [Mycena indigotica]